MELHLRTRNDVKQRHIGNNFNKWALNSITQNLVCQKSDKSTFWRHNKTIWSTSSSVPKPTAKEHAIIFDGTYLGKRWMPIELKKCCMVMRNLKTILYFSWIESESNDSADKFLLGIPPSDFVVCDERREILNSLRKMWPNTKIQRCMKHVVDYVQRQLTWQPETAAGQYLLRGAMTLWKIKTHDDKTKWLNSLKLFGDRFNDFINEKTCIHNPKTNRKWFYTHKRLRSAYRLLKTLSENNHLFNFLEDPLNLIPRTSNAVEGGIFSPIKHLLKVHRGAPLEHQKIIVEHWLINRMKKG